MSPLPPLTTIVVPRSGAFEWQRAWKPGSDLLLLSEGAELSPDSIGEMQAVLHLHERHGAVSPRTSAPSLLSLPPYANDSTSAAAFDLWQHTAPLLARYQVIPSAVSECVLIQSRAFEWFGPLRECFGSFVSALEDFLHRMNRRGFSVVAANRAFVSFTAQPTQSSAHDRDTLLYLYPESETKIEQFETFERDPIERFAGLYNPHRPRILYDLFHLTDKHNGTSEFGLSLLASLAREVKNDADLFVGAQLSNRFFLPELSGYRIYDNTQTKPEVFDLAFKPSQLLSWPDFQRLDSLAPRMTFALQDIIGIRCDYLNSPARQFVLQKAAEFADHVFTISDFTAADFSTRFGESITSSTIYHGTNFGYHHEESLPGEHILVVGNEFAHKALADLLPHLPFDVPVVLLGGTLNEATPNIRAIPSGELTRQHLRDLFARATVVIYPSYYEGFGLPVMDALALGKPAIVLDTSVNRELDKLLEDPNLHRIANFAALPATLAALRAHPRTSPNIRHWSQSAAEYANAFRELLARDIDRDKVRARRAFLRAVLSAG